MSLIKCGRLLLGKSQTLDPIADRVAAVVCVFLNGVLVCVCVCVMLSLTRAGKDQGPNIPPDPVSGSNSGTMQSRKADDRGA